MRPRGLQTAGSPQSSPVPVRSTAQAAAAQRSGVARTLPAHAWQRRATSPDGSLACVQEPGNAIHNTVHASYCLLNALVCKALYQGPPTPLPPACRLLMPVMPCSTAPVTPVNTTASQLIAYLSSSANILIMDLLIQLSSQTHAHRMWLHAHSNEHLFPSGCRVSEGVQVRVRGNGDMLAEAHAEEAAPGGNRQPSESQH